jgi:hypothetical protein
VTAATSSSAVAGGIDPIARWSADLAERANPLTVRLVRQHLRAPSFLILFVLQLVLGLLAAIVVAGANVHLLMSGGRLLYVVLVSVWMLTAWVVAPILLTNAIRAERQETTWELLDLTGMRPLAILSGYLGAAAIQQLLLLSAIAPFLVLSWLLRGLDPVLLAAAVIIVPFGGLLSVAGGLQAACSPRKKTGRNAAISMGAGGVLGWLFMSNGLFWLMFSGSETRLIEGLWRGDAAVWLSTLLLGNLVLHALVTTLVSTAMNLTHPAEDRSFAPRLLAWAMTLNAVVWLVLAWSLGVALVTVMSWIGAIVVGRTVTLGIGAISEPYSRTPRQQSSWQNVHGWRGRLAWALAPGAASGRRCYLALIGFGITTSIASLLWAGSHEMDPLAAITIGIACYATWFLVLGDLIFRRLIPAHRHRPHWQRGLTVTLAVVASVIGWLSFILLHDHLPVLAPIDILGGMQSMIELSKSPDSNTRQMHLPTVLIVLLFGIGSAIVLLRQSFRPVTIERLRPEDS